MELVVIASRIEANIFKHTRYGSLKLIKHIENPTGRLKNKSLRHDKPGVSRAKFKGAAPHNLSNEQSPHEDSAHQFAKDIVRHLKSRWDIDHGLSFKIVSEPKFIGMIKSYVEKSKISTEVIWVKKDLQNIPPHQWPKLLGLKVIPMKKDLGVVAKTRGQ